MKCSIVIPCRNEARYIRACLDSVMSNDLPHEDFEVLVADGMSTDGTREVLAEYTARFPSVQILDNPTGTTPCALNIAIRRAAAPVIIRIDAHSTIERDYFRRCLQALEESGADNVGGVMHAHPSTRSRWSSAITAVLSHRFGVGNATFRTHTGGPRWVDTVHGGCYPREVFSRIGFFNEQLRRGQDMEFNRRLTAAGGRIWLDPRIVTHYYARTDLRSFCGHNWTNGVWAIYPFVYSNVVPVSVRHLVPLAFASSLVVTAAAALFWRPAALLFAAIAVAYLSVALAVSIRTAVRLREAALAVLMPVTFFLLHALYGFGSLYAILRLMFEPLAWTRVRTWWSGSRTLRAS